jgi:hypothetical protein
MATTDARSGFRLPWAADQRSPEDGGSEDVPDTEATVDEGAEATAEATADAAPDATLEAPQAATRAARSSAATAGGKKPSKFLADLTRAMQAAAESAREESLSRLQADAKTWIEQIHSRSADGATDLRRRADDEVAAIREWSKAEMARIREETDSRIATRKQRLEVEIEEHAAGIEQRIEAVQGRVTAFENEMAAFFERLLGEEDPGQFAALAENMPEPPPFDDLADEAAVDSNTTADAASAPVTAVADTADDPEAAMAAIQAAAEAAAAEETDAPAEAATDGTPPDFAAAEAEALAGVNLDDDSELPVLNNDELNARLAHLVPAAGDDTGEATKSSVVVTGLVSVASIASFKRHLGRLGGVQSVAVSSGPDGEFIFAVTHLEGANLRDAIPSLPGFRARVTGGSDDTIEVSARDPDPQS